MANGHEKDLLTQVLIAQRDMENLAETVEKVSVIVTANAKEFNSNLTELALIKKSLSENSSEIEKIVNILSNRENGLIFQIIELKRQNEANIKRIDDEKIEMVRSYDRKLVIIGLSLTFLSIVIPAILTIIALVYYQK